MSMQVAPLDAFQILGRSLQVSNKVLTFSFARLFVAGAKNRGRMDNGENWWKVRFVKYFTPMLRDAKCTSQ